MIVSASFKEYFVFRNKAVVRLIESLSSKCDKL